MDDSFLKTVVHPCLNGMSPDLAIECYYDIMSRRADGVMDGVFYWDSYHTQFESIVLLTDLTLDMLVKTRSQKSDDRVRMLKNLEPMLTRSLPRTYQHFCDVYSTSSTMNKTFVASHLGSFINNSCVILIWWNNLHLADATISAHSHRIFTARKLITMPTTFSMHAI
ncbi:hypothetical protein A0H81_07177 [Grifola frondosa]|uniref:Uncharacterized protein n=1 Tax=Grifola frondosa TaxID=5627 RepID=A0A1C7M8S8_GRIFR|nr:hypothetical protein A0H81_07177 [Grifola frondosa]